MSDRVRDWLVDLGKYKEILWQRTVEARIGGVDYSGPQYTDMCQQVVERLHPRRMELSVVDVIQETPSTKTLRFKRLDGAIPPHRAGQYVNLFVTIGDVRTSRPYSIVSRPCAETIDITVRSWPLGFVSSWLCSAVNVGDVLISTGPLGDFYHEPLFHGDDLVYIAGGSGITPFMSMLRYKEQRALDQQKVHLIYGSKDNSDVIYESELDRLAGEMPNFTWDKVISDPPKSWKGLRGFIDKKMVSLRLDDLDGKTFFICGPTALQKLVHQSLTELGVPGHKIISEAFGPPWDVTKEPGWPEGIPREEVFNVDVEGMKRIHACAGEPLMNSLERNGIVIPARCRTGRCSACNTKVLEGKVYMPPVAVLRESNWLNRYVHACVSYPVENLTISISPIR